jgi:hypothetical protein
MQPTRSYSVRAALWTVQVQRVFVTIEDSDPEMHVDIDDRRVRRAVRRSGTMKMDEISCQGMRTGPESSLTANEAEWTHTQGEPLAGILECGFNDL